MNPLKSTLVGIGLAIGLATVASAQSMTPEVTDGIAKVVPGNGSYLGGNAANASYRILMKHSTRLKAGSNVYRSGSSLDAVRAQIGGEAVEDAWQGWRRNF